MIKRLALTSIVASVAFGVATLAQAEDWKEIDKGYALDHDAIYSDEDARVFYIRMPAKGTNYAVAMHAMNCKTNIFGVMSMSIYDHYGKLRASEVYEESQVEKEKVVKGSKMADVQKIVCKPNSFIVKDMGWKK